MIRDGKLRAIAVSSAKRSSSLPDVPTIAESGVPGFEFTLWFGLWGPAGMPANIVDKISKDVHRALADPGVRERLAEARQRPDGHDAAAVQPVRAPRGQGLRAHDQGGGHQAAVRAALA